MSSFCYQSLEASQDLEQIVDLEIGVWNIDPRDAAPSSLMHALVLVGGLAVGAYDRERLIGLALAFPGQRYSKRILWSHMAGVHPDYQGQGIGFGLKQFQRTWALERGYRTICWTYDPLQSGNAKFNLHRLGVISNIYHVDFYGEMTDGINAGLPSDRLEVIWDLRNPRVKKLAVDEPVRDLATLSLGDCVLYADSDCRAVANLMPFESKTQVYAEIPRNIGILKRTDPALALSWRLALREVLQAAFAKGYVAADFITVDERCFYKLSMAVPWFLYVVECSDGSLYTGVSPEVGQRLAVHNAGRGAAYTASRRPVKFVGAWRFVDKVSALRAERSFKGQTRASKLALIASRALYLDAPFIWFDL